MKEVREQIAQELEKELKELKESMRTWRGQYCERYNMNDLGFVEGMQYAIKFLREGRNVDWAKVYENFKWDFLIDEGAKAYNKADGWGNGVDFVLQMIEQSQRDKSESEEDWESIKRDIQKEIFENSKSVGEDKSYPNSLKYVLSQMDKRRYER